MVPAGCVPKALGLSPSPSRGGGARPGLQGTYWVITQASKPFHAPFLAMIHLPPPDSSAGVPITTRVPGRPRALMTASAPTAEASEDVAMRLCPQAWPTPGSASYSALKHTVRPSPVGGPRERRASNAVSIPCTPRLTDQPRLSSQEESSAQALFSSKRTSGLLNIFASLASATARGPRGPSPDDVRRGCTLGLSAEQGCRAHL